MLATLAAPEDVLHRPAKPRLPWRYLWGAGLVALALFFLYEVGRRVVGSNFHTVFPGRVYRGAQPSPQTIEELAKDHGVHTIVNLRGCGLPTDWYAKEVEATQGLGMDQEDICFSPTRLPSSSELHRLVEVLDGAAYPIFLHCRRGADRTGMAAAIVMLLQHGDRRGVSPTVTLTEARKQLGLWYGHVALGETGVLDQFLDLYDEWLAKQRRPHDCATFRHWLLEEYHGGWCSAKFEEFTPLAAQSRIGEPLGYRVRVRNTGTKDWHMHAGSQSGVHLAYQVWDGPRLVAEGRAGMFDKGVTPGGVVNVTLVVKPLSQPGRFRFLVDMVEEQHCWFYQAGSEPHEEELVVAE